MPWQKSLVVGRNKLWRRPLLTLFLIIFISHRETEMSDRVTGFNCTYRAMICLHYFTLSIAVLSCSTKFRSFLNSSKMLESAITDLGFHSFLNYWWDDMLSLLQKIYSFPQQTSWVMSHLCLSPTVILFFLICRPLRQDDTICLWPRKWLQHKSVLGCDSAVVKGCLGLGPRSASLELRKHSGLKGVVHQG